MCVWCVCVFWRFSTSPTYLQFGKSRLIKHFNPIKLLKSSILNPQSSYIYLSILSLHTKIRQLSSISLRKPFSIPYPHLFSSESISPFLAYYLVILPSGKSGCIALPKRYNNRGRKSVPTEQQTQKPLTPESIYANERMVDPNYREGADRHAVSQR